MDDLRTEVARAVSHAIGADGASPQAIADAAIAVVLERAAKVAEAEKYDLGSDHDNETLAYDAGIARAVDAIRTLAEEQTQ